MTNRTPPHDDELERAFLNCALLEPELPVVKQLQPGDFYSRAHQVIYRAIRTLLEMNCRPDITTLKIELRANGDFEDAGRDYIDSLLKSVPSSANADYYAEEIKSYAIRRGLLKVASKLIRIAYDESFDIVGTKDRFSVALDIIDNIEKYEREGTA